MLRRIPARTDRPTHLAATCRPIYRSLSYLLGHLPIYPRAHLPISVPKGSPLARHIHTTAASFQKLSKRTVPVVTGMPASCNALATLAHSHSPSKRKGFSNRRKWRLTFPVMIVFAARTYWCCLSRSVPRRRREDLFPFLYQA